MSAEENDSLLGKSPSGGAAGGNVCGKPAAVCCSCCCCMFALLASLVLIPVVPFPGPAAYESTLWSHSYHGCQFGMSNYVLPLGKFVAAAVKTSNWRQPMRDWYLSFTDDDPEVGHGLGSNTTLWWGYDKVKEKLQALGPMEKEGMVKRETELAFTVFNNLFWPDVGKSVLGLEREDHAFVRPYLASMFDAAQDKPHGWTDEYLHAFFKNYLANVSTIKHLNTQKHRFIFDVILPSQTKTFFTRMILRMLHKMALGIELSEADAREIASAQSLGLIIPPVPANLVRGILVWKSLGEPYLATCAKFMSMYKPAIKKRFPDKEWTDRELTLVASTFLDAMLQAGGRSVPLAIDIVLGYILTKNQPADLIGVDFRNETNIRALMFEAMRYHPVVTTLPFWSTEDGGHTWLHEAIGLGPALADPKIWPEPDTFKLDRPEEMTVAWADFATVNNDTANPDSHSCPGKHLSIATVVAFIQEFFAAGPWVVEDDDIKMNYYGSSGFTVSKM